MTIMQRDTVRAAVKRALLECLGNEEKAIDAVAQALCLPAEAVREVLEEQSDEVVA